MHKYQKIGIKTPRILLPNKNIDLRKWAVIACDQFTAQPEYWQEVENIVGDAPSTYHMILPEVFLETPQEEERIKNANIAMQNYLQSGIFTSMEGFIYVRRKLNGQTRRGLMVCLDLEHYDYTPGAQTLIRASEGTIVDRLPPRIRIRKQAVLETPHILVLFDDSLDTVFGPLEDQLGTFEKLYDFELMLGSGHLEGYAINNDAIQQGILTALEQLIDPETFANKYALEPGKHQPMLFAMGDGNHSLATAKAIWEEIKPSVGSDHPARYALVEIENVHDPALAFEPIYRVLFDLNTDILQEMHAYWGDSLRVEEVDTPEELIAAVDAARGSAHKVGMITSDGLKLITIHDAKENLPVGTLQHFLDMFMANQGAEKIDYIHGEDVLFEMGTVEGNVGFYIPGMDKSDLFKTMILDGALPRKTFSMGSAKTKRFYMECRRIQPAS
ncbi:MAG TPA: DUF1015 domain-containing protein [Brevefilum fermentans]|jgi:hypothetical protein|nr:DUF1015 domain-containing protein [Chloroflexota bacterium]HPX95058.1 DUF1015 domain-containing protein [Brevefilum fermentans]HQA28077.1 DUF1015 domain-containing protein [Brevefilum fermentans]